jgi:hypothetical protein
MSSIISRIEDLAGDSFFTLSSTSESTYNSVLTRFVKEGVRDVVDRTLQVNPKDMHLFCQNILIKEMGKWGDNQNELTFGDHNIPWKDADGGFLIDNNYILWISRNFEGLKVPCQEVSAEKGLKVEDPESIYYTGTDYRNPVFYRSSSKVYIYPTMSESEKGWGSIVSYDNKFTLVDSDGNKAESIDYFPDHLLFLVVLYAARKGLNLVKSQKRKEYTDKYSTPIAVWETLYGADSSLPEIPSFPTDLPDFGDSFSASYSFPDDIHQDTELTGDMTESAESVKGAFNNMWNRINDAEEVDLVSAEINRFSTIMSEFNTQVSTLNTRHGNILGKYTAQLNSFQQQYQTVMDAWTRYQQSYQNEVTLLDAEIQRLTQEYMSYFLPKHHLEKTKEEGNY